MTKETTAGKIIDVVALTLSTGIAVASEEYAWSNSFPLPRQSSFSVSLRFSTGGATDVVVSIEQSNVKPTTEKAADTTNYALPVDVAGSSVGAIATITDEVMHVINFAPLATGFARLKFKGQNLNAATTKVVIGELYYVKGQ